MEARALIVVVAVGLTSLAACAIARRRGAARRWPADAWGWIPIEALGLGMLFLAANMMVAALAIVIGRAVSEEYLAVYVLDDVTLLAASLCQGVVFRLRRLELP